MATETNDFYMWLYWGRYNEIWY